ncbi:unnamed protein product [Prunus brigantina]
MARAYIVFKNRLHDHYKKVATTLARGRATLPPDILWNKRPVEHWHWLCDKMYTKPTFVESNEDIEANSIEVPIEAEFKIMGDVLGVKGRTVRGLGAFP